MSLFKLKKPPQLKDALHFLNASTEVLLRMKQRREYLPDEQDFTLLRQIYEEAQNLRLVATYVECCLHQRQRGEPESPPPWERDKTTH